MKKNNSVIFKGGKSGIIVLLDERASFKDITTALREKTRSASGFFSGAQTSLVFKGKQLTEDEIVTLLEIIDEETNLSFTFVEDLTGPAVTEIAPPPLPDPSFEPKPADDTYFHKHSLRNGQAIIQNGSVVVLGDVNSGAEIIATGNVLVFGALRGMVHAGSGGNEKAFICAMTLQPTQVLRIANEKVIFPGEGFGDNKIDPGFAFLKDGDIHVRFVADI
ncbi:MAG: hypothetical protein FWB98_02185 [Defluviitaleaceae bacterium]|nr:hypothetical protein [Defluviitaleaceae bacterium]